MAIIRPPKAFLLEGKGQYKVSKYKRKTLSNVGHMHTFNKNI
jgi:hypothetical protein